MATKPWHTKMPLGSKHHWAYIDAVKRRRRRVRRAASDDIAFSATYTPVNGDDMFPYTNSPSVVFNQEVTPGTGDIVLFTSGGSVVETFDVATGAGSAGGSVVFDGDAVTINPNADLVIGDGYYITVPSHAIQGVGGNFFDGISGPSGWAFTASDLYITMETGDYLLLENGDKIYLEAYDG